MDLGLDLEAYKDFVNNIKQFAHLNNDFEIYARDQLIADNPEFRELIELEGNESQINPDCLDKETRYQVYRVNILNTLKKLKRKAAGFLTKDDEKNLKELTKDMRLYLSDFDIYVKLR